MPRTYRSDIRREQAAQTRRVVVDAAVAVFSDRGWSGTTMTLVAAAAGVAVETVYRAVPGGKAALMAAAVQAALAGGAKRAAVPTDERPGIRRVIDAIDPHTALRQYAHTLSGTWNRAGPLLAVLDRTDSETSLERLRADLEAQRLAGMLRFARQLHTQGALRRGVTAEIAADVLWTVCSRANHDALVGARGWSSSDYISWVSRTLAASLLEPE